MRKYLLPRYILKRLRKEFNLFLDTKEATIIKALNRKRDMPFYKNEDVLFDVFWRYDKAMGREVLLDFIRTCTKEWCAVEEMFELNLDLVKRVAVSKSLRVINNG